MDFENAGEGKSEGAGVNGIGVRVRTKRTKEHRQIDIHYVTSDKQTSTGISVHRV